MLDLVSRFIRNLFSEITLYGFQSGGDGVIRTLDRPVLSHDKLCPLGGFLN